MSNSKTVKLLTLLIISFNAHSQHKIDSLKNVLAIATDTARAITLNNLAFELIYTNPQESEKLALEAIKYSEDINYYKGVAKAYHVLGVSYDIRGNYVLASGSFQSGINVLSMHESVKADRGIHASLLNGLGLAYYHQSRYSEALTCFFQSIKLLESSKDNPRLGNLHNNIGLVYHDLREYDKALEYYNRGFEYAKSASNNNLAGRSANNMGLIFSEKKDYKSAIKFYELSLEYKKNNGDENGISATYLNLGTVYKHLGDYGKALNYLNLSLEIKIKVNDKLGILNVGDAKADILIRQKKFKEAELQLKENLKMVDSLETREPKTLVFERYYDLYKNQGKYKEALEWYVRKAQLQDSLFNAEKNMQVLEIETKYETEKKEQTIKLLESEKRMQLIWRYYLLIAIFLIGLIYFLQRSRTKKAKELLHIQKKYNTQLKETDLLKSRFFANISHEFRTPLTLILAPIEDKLKSSILPISDKNDLRMVKRNANRLLDLVNQLLDLSKLEANKMELQFMEGNLDEFLRVFVASFNSMAEHKKIVFSKNIATPIHTVLFDADKLEKIISNILFNAFKFTPEGGLVTLSIYTSPDENELHIKIADTGIGISKEDQPHVFSPFYQSKHTFDDGQLGTGLGLSLVNELVKLHHGQIELLSQVNNGTTISITLPIKHQSNQVSERDTNIR
jgi:signal transduction histidine kinase/tetratricopeptide (TPR) repeat protein